MHVYMFIITVGLLTVKIDRATQTFLKVDMRHGAYRRGKNISDMIWAFP